MSLSKAQLAEMEEDEKSAEQFEAYNEEQDRLEKLYNKQQEEVAIEEAISLLKSKGYTITK